MIPSFPQVGQPLPPYFGRYQILERLGSGGMADVYRARLEGIQGFAKTVALKVFRRHLSMDPQFAPTFTSEARLGGYLHHENIIASLDFGTFEGHLFMAMEYIQGPTLLRLLEFHRQSRLPFPLDATLQIMIQLCKALDYAHEATDNDGRPLRMVHRDLKPSNVLITQTGTVKVADFGVARAESNTEHTAAGGLLKGTIRYMSPEQAWGRKNLDRRSDLFALGLLLYEMLALRTLYDGTSQEEILRQAQDAEVGGALLLLPELPERPALLSILLSALARYPEQRYQTAGEMGQALEALRKTVAAQIELRVWVSAIFREVADRSFSRTTLHEVASPEPPPLDPTAMSPSWTIQEAPDLASVTTTLREKAEDKGGDDPTRVAFPNVERGETLLSPMPPTSSDVGPGGVAPGGDRSPPSVPPAGERFAAEGLEIQSYLPVGNETVAGPYAHVAPPIGMETVAGPYAHVVPPGNEIAQGHSPEHLIPPGFETVTGAYAHVDAGDARIRAAQFSAFPASRQAPWELPPISPRAAHPVAIPPLIDFSSPPPAQDPGFRHDSGAGGDAETVLGAPADIRVLASAAAEPSPPDASSRSNLSTQLLTQVESAASASQKVDGAMTLGAIPVRVKQDSFTPLPQPSPHSAPPQAATVVALPVLPPMPLPVLPTPVPSIKTTPAQVNLRRTDAYGPTVLLPPSLLRSTNPRTKAAKPPATRPWRLVAWVVGTLLISVVGVVVTLQWLAGLLPETQTTSAASSLPRDSAPAVDSGAVTVVDPKSMADLEPATVAQTGTVDSASLVATAEVLPLPLPRESAVASSSSRASAASVPDAPNVAASGSSASSASRVGTSASSPGTSHAVTPPPAPSFRPPRSEEQAPTFGVSPSKQTASDSSKVKESSARANSELPTAVPPEKNSSASRPSRTIESSEASGSGGEPAAASSGGAGRLFVNAQPAATIELDGRTLSGFPIQNLEVRGGNHVLVILWPDGGRLEERFVMAAGGQVRCMADQARGTIRCRGGQ